MFLKCRLDAIFTHQNIIDIKAILSMLKRY